MKRPDYWFRFRTYCDSFFSYHFFHADHAPFVWAAVLAPSLTALIALYV